VSGEKKCVSGEHAGMSVENKCESGEKKYVSAGEKNVAW
jgi:hypothetical protein